jgi:hypothetical protein
MGWWTRRAKALQSHVVEIEAELRPRALAELFPPERAQQASVLARQDLISAVSQLDSLNAQVSSIKWVLVLIAALLGAVVIRM